MSFVWNLPLFMIVGCLFSGALCLLLKGRTACRYSAVLTIGLILADILVLHFTAKTGSFTFSMGEFPAPWGNEIRAGTLECSVLLVFLCVILCSLLAGYRYLLRDVDESKINLYCALLNLASAATCALVFTNDMFTGYVFLEIMTLASCGLMISRETGRTTLASVRYMIMNLLGSGLYLLGVTLLYGLTGHLLLVPLQETISMLAQDPSLHLTLTFSVAMITIGLSVKSGLFPFHFWMPDAYGYATPTTASIMSSVVSKAYIFLLVKIYYRALGPAVMEQIPVRKILFVLGIAGMVFGSISALHTNDINRMIAYSSAAQIGYIYMSLGIGGSFGYRAAIVHLMAHAVTKSLLFLTVPRLSDASGGSRIFRDLQGSALRDRYAGFCFTACALSMVGIPLFAGFSSKFLILLAATDNRNPAVSFIVLIALAVSTLVNTLYFIRTVIRIWSRPQENTASSAAVSPASGTKSDRPVYRVADQGPVSLCLYRIPGCILLAGIFMIGLFPSGLAGLLDSGLRMFS